ncbi:18023_t:CDS:1, partial [Dentiscutata erythropus]
RFRTLLNEINSYLDRLTNLNNLNNDRAKLQVLTQNILRIMDSMNFTDGEDSTII